MSGKWIQFVGLIGILISSTNSCEENCNATPSHIVITDSEALKKIELRNPSNASSIPAVIQQGNNFFIKPKFIIGSPFTYDKKSYMKSAENVSTLSKIPVVEPGIVTGNLKIPKPPKIFVPPPPPVLPPLSSFPPLSPRVIAPAGVPRNVPVPIDIIPSPPKVPIAIPNLCHSMPCPPNTVPGPAPPILVQEPVYLVISKPPEVPKLPVQVIPTQPNLPRLPAPPVVVQKPVFPVLPTPPKVLPPIVPKLPVPVIPIQPHLPRLPMPPILGQQPLYPIISKPRDVLPPIMPKLPIQITVQTPMVPTPNQRILLAPCAMAKSNSNSDSPFTNMFSDIQKKFKNLINEAYGHNTTTVPPKDEETSEINRNMTDATLCVQGIITERVVPNIITNNDVKLFMTPLSPYQLAHFNNYGK